MKKIIILIFIFVLISGCVQSTAMVGPAIAGATSGNIYQAGLSYGTNLTLKEKTGKSAGQHVIDYKKKIEKNLKNLVEKDIKLTRKDNSLNKNN